MDWEFFLISKMLFYFEIVKKGVKAGDRRTDRKKEYQEAGRDPGYVDLQMRVLRCQDPTE